MCKGSKAQHMQKEELYRCWALSTTDKNAAEVPLSVVCLQARTRNRGLRKTNEEPKTEWEMGFMPYITLFFFGFSFHKFQDQKGH